MNTIVRNAALLTFVAACAAPLAIGCGGNPTGTGGTGGTGGSTGGTGGSTGGTGGTGGTAQGKADGSPCVESSECESGYCLTQADFGFPNGYCTGACNTFVECAEGSECIYFANEPFCFKGCKAKDDCGSGQQCLEIDETTGLSV